MGNVDQYWEEAQELCGATAGMKDDILMFDDVSGVSEPHRVELSQIYKDLVGCAARASDLGDSADLDEEWEIVNKCTKRVEFLKTFYAKEIEKVEY